MKANSAIQSHLYLNNLLASCTSESTYLIICIQKFTITYWNVYMTIEGLVYNIHIIYKTIIYSKTVHIQYCSVFVYETKHLLTKLINLAYEIKLHRKSPYTISSVLIPMYVTKHAQNTRSILFIAKNELAYGFKNHVWTFTPSIFLLRRTHLSHIKIPTHLSQTY
jgi:hypothetical protein